MPAASRCPNKEFSRRRVRKAIQNLQNFWLELDDVEYNIRDLPDKITPLKKFLCRYAISQLIFEQVGVATFVGITEVATALAAEYATGFAGEHHVFTYPIVRQEDKLLALYINNISLINRGSENGAIIPSRVGVWFNKNLQIVKIKFAPRSNPIPYPTSFNWLPIDFPSPPRHPSRRPKSQIDIIIMNCR